MHVGHLPLTALEPNLRRNQGGAFRKDRQLQLRHASILPSPSLSRKRTGGQLIFQNGSQNHGMRSGVLKVIRLRRWTHPTNDAEDLLQRSALRITDFERDPELGVLILEKNSG